MRHRSITFSTEIFDNFSTFEVTNIDALLNTEAPIDGAKEFIGDQPTRELIGDGTFKFIDEAYDYLGGFKSFKDKDHFINDSYLWYITYDGPRPTTIKNFDPEKVLVVSVYRKSFGLKLVGIARRNTRGQGATHMENSEIRRRADSALAAHLKFMAKHGWAEVSDNLERWCFKVLGESRIIDPVWLKENGVIKNLELDHYNDYYYFRLLRKDGPMLHKIAFGTPRV